MTEREIDSVPAENLRVCRAEFGAVWSAAEEKSAAQGDRRIDWHAGGVALTCRWMARAISEDAQGRRRLTVSPVGGVRTLASEELIEAEFVAAELLLARRPASSLVTGHSGFVEAAAATLRWAWRASGPAPMLVPPAAD